MSLKPLKKSDMNKNWMKARRDTPKKIQPEYHLIVTEGTKTEPAYFQAIKEIINVQYREKVHLDVYGEGSNTIGLVERAKKRVSDNPNGYKHVWIVYDTDDFPAENIDKTVTMCEQATKESQGETQYHATWSNQCIELWFLLHFSYMQSDLHRREYWLKISECLNSISAGNYEKNRNDMYAILEPYMDFAIENAKKLDRVNAGKTPSKAAPGTKVYELVDKLRPYLK